MFRCIFRAFNHSESEEEISLASKAYGCHLRLVAWDLILAAAVSNLNLDMQNMRLRRVCNRIMTLTRTVTLRLNPLSLRVRL